MAYCKAYCMAYRFKTIDHWGSQGHALACFKTHRLKTIDQSGSRGYAVAYFRTHSSTSCGVRYSTPVSTVLEVSHRTSSPLCECGGQWFLVGTVFESEFESHALLRMFGLVISERCTSFDIKLGCVLTYQDRERHGCRARAYRDVLAASPGKLIHIPAPPTLQIIESKASDPFRRQAWARRLS